MLFFRNRVVKFQLDIVIPKPVKKLRGYTSTSLAVIVAFPRHASA